MTTIFDDPDFRAGSDDANRLEFASAVPLLQKAVGRYPDDPEGHFQLGLAMQRRAERILPPSLRERAERTGVAEIANSLLGLGVLAASRAIGQTDWIVQYRQAFRDSVAEFERAIALSPNDARVYHALSLSHRYLGQTEAAAAAAAKAAGLQPDQTEYVERASAFDTAASREAQGREVREGHHGAMTWNDVVLPDKTKRELRQMQLLLENPSLARDLGIDPPTGLLLYGPPGTGKTTIARVLAYESHCAFLATSPAQINSMWLGESEKAVKRLFDEARAKSPAIIFLDEIDALLPSRTGGINQYSDKVVNQFLHEMDGLQRNRRIFVVGATNRRDMLDPALLRGGRLSREIEIPLPDLASRSALFALSTVNARLDDDVDVADIAARTEGWSGANIKALVNEAGLQALIRISEAMEGRGSDIARTLNKSDFDVALANFTPPKEEDNTPTHPWRWFPGS